MDAEQPRLRQVTPADADFLFALYASTREEELRVWGWPAPAQQAFLALQHRAREAAYAAEYPTSEDAVVLLGSAPAGRLRVSRTDRPELVLIDVALLPSHRGRGVGTRLLRDLCAEADGARRLLRLSVPEGSRALHLYQRVGFVLGAAQPPYLTLTREPRDPP